MVQTMNTSFWLLDAPRNQRPLVVAEGPAYTRTPCPANDRHGMIKRVGDLHVVAHPSGLKDFTWTWMSDMLISPKVLALFEHHDVTGFEVRPVKAEYPKPVKVPPPELYEVIVTGWAGLPTREAGLTPINSCPTCGYKKFTIAEPSRLIDPTAWDGSDIFMVWPAPRHPFVSDRLAGIIRKEKLSGAKLIPAQEIPMKRGTTLNPGSLYEWMPEERASLLRQQFGIY
jgi:hypothetical protein